MFSTVFGLRLKKRVELPAIEKMLDFWQKGFGRELKTASFVSGGLSEWKCFCKSYSFFSGLCPTVFRSICQKFSLMLSNLLCTAVQKKALTEKCSLSSLSKCFFLEKSSQKISHLRKKDLGRGVKSAFYGSQGRFEENHNFSTNYSSKNFFKLQTESFWILFKRFFRPETRNWVAHVQSNVFAKVI